MRLSLRAVLPLALCLLGASGQASIFPKPSSIVAKPGHFRFGHTAAIAANGCLKEAEFFASLVSNAGVKATTRASKLSSRISFLVNPKLKALGTEGYRLTVNPGGIRLSAATSAGIFYGVQTLRQMLPYQIESAHKMDLSIPCCEVTDTPRFSWRGTMLDVSRHFFEKGDIFRLLDLMAMHKLNVFHWHLVDDGGWRIEIKKYPNLTNIGAYRKPMDALWDQSLVRFPGRDSGGPMYGGFYTQDDIREIVRYATDRHIMVVPEIEMPAHSLAATASYPSLICTDASVSEFAAATGFYQPNVLCAGKESTFEFVEGVLDEVFKLFPSKYLHIGGDEVDKSLWMKCPDCQTRMAKNGLNTPEQLQSYFIRRIEKYVNSKGKRLIGWDEILQGGLAPNACVMSWRSIGGGVEAAVAGHDAVMSPESHSYFNHLSSALPLEHVLAFDPIPGKLPASVRHHILGGQANLWTELVPDMATLEQRLFPRLIAMSEVLWSAKPDRGTAFFKRLSSYYNRLDAMSVRYEAPAPSSSATAAFLGETKRISFGIPPIQAAAIRYTEDGSKPTVSSPIYREPLSVSSPETIRAMTFLPDGRTSDDVRVIVGTREYDYKSSQGAGLTWRLFEGDWNKVPSFEGLTGAKSGFAGAIGLVGDGKVNYALEFKGAIKIPRAGTYKFYLESDDGSVLWIGGLKVVDNDGPHGTIEKSGSIALKPGYYPLRIGYQQGGGGQSLKASIEGPGLAKQAIPAKLLSH